MKTLSYPQKKKVNQSIKPLFFLSLFPSISPPIYLSPHLSFPPSISPPIYLSSHLFLPPSISPPISLSPSLSHPISHFSLYISTHLTNSLSLPVHERTSIFISISISITIYFPNLPNRAQKTSTYLPTYVLYCTYPNWFFFNYPSISSKTGGGWVSFSLLQIFSFQFLSVSLSLKKKQKSNHPTFLPANEKEPARSDRYD